MSLITHAKISALTKQYMPYHIQQHSIKLIQDLLATKWRSNKRCIINTAAVPPCPLSDKSWWLQNTCHINNKDYEYYYYFQFIAHTASGNYYRCIVKFTKPVDLPQLWQIMVNDRINSAGRYDVSKLILINSVN